MRVLMFDELAPACRPRLPARISTGTLTRTYLSVRQHRCRGGRHDGEPRVSAGLGVRQGAPRTCAPEARPPAAPQPRPGPRTGRAGRGLLAAWPLLVVLAVQAVLSLRLVWSTTAFQDEALYLRAGHLEWAHWLHQAPVPAFPAYFSGAPVLYPPLAAAADSLGGLAAARLLSLCFMLGVTGLLWATTARLYGRRAALLASGLFATLAGTQFLGAFATFDAMALFLLALAAWLAVRAAAGRPVPDAGRHCSPPRVSPWPRPTP